MSVVLILFAWLISPEFQGWKTLQQLELRKSYDDFLGEEVEVPVFSEELKAFDGKRVTVDGFVIPLQAAASQDYFVLSRFPYNNCFFCGNAGPETVAEVYTTRKFDMVDTKVRVTGTLELNADDPLHLFFIFSNASVEVLD